MVFKISGQEKKIFHTTFCLKTMYDYAITLIKLKDNTGCPAKLFEGILGNLRDFKGILRDLRDLKGF